LTGILAYALGATGLTWLLAVFVGVWPLGLLLIRAVPPRLHLHHVGLLGERE
jgi:hypothetical protein